MSAPPPVKIAVIGLGLIGPHHAAAVLHDSNATLTCLVDPSPAAAQIANRLNVPLHPSIPAMLSSPHIPTAVILCTPTPTHAALATTLLSAHIHVLCEKPLSTSPHTARALVAHAAAHDTHLLTAHHRRFAPHVAATAALLPSLGEITAVSGLWTLYKPPAYFAPPWRRAAGPVLTNLIHDLDVLHHLFGRIARVAGFPAKKRRGHEAEEGGAVVLQFASGVVGTFVLSDAVVSPYAWELGTGENAALPRAEGGVDAYRVFGTEGTLSVPDLVRWSYGGGERSWEGVLRREKVGLEEVVGEEERGRTPLELQVAHLVRVVRGEERPVCGGEEGVAAVEVAEAVRRAWEGGGVVEVGGVEKARL